MSLRRGLQFAWMLALGGALGWLTATTPAAAESTVWRRAASPRDTDAADTLAAVRGLLDRHVAAMGKPGDGDGRWDALMAARRMLEERHADTSTMPELRYAAARVERTLYGRDGRKDHLVQAIGHLRWIVGDARGVPTMLRAAALFELAVCHAHREERHEEIAVYVADLAVEPHAIHRSLVLANQADALMFVGDLAAAIGGYRAALSLLHGVVLHSAGATTLWGLAVALDRSGDPARALETVALARSYDPDDSQLGGPNWFFVPERESHWYAALGHWSRARSTREAATRATEYSRAEASFRAYVEASPVGDRWQSLASVRGAECAKEAAKSRAGAGAR